MAGTYGEPGKNPFTVPGVGGILSPVVDSTTGITQIYRQDSGLNPLIGKPIFTSVGTYNPRTNTITPQKDSNGNLILSKDEINALSSPSGISNISDKAKTTATQGLIATGKDPKIAQTQANQLVSKNNANNTDTGAQQAAIQQDISTAKARKKYDLNLKYPADLQVDYQDVIQFNMLEYVPQSLNSSANQGLGSFSDRPDYTKRTVIGRVFLPIQGGISDTNAVTWGSDSLSPLEKALATLAQSAITGGAEAAAKTAETQAQQVSQSSGDIKVGLTAMFVEAATGATNLVSRTKGAIQNPNMQLLFSAPTLRPFSFRFKLSARGTDDRDQIRKIIRFFKQGMSVQRTESQLFLKAPNTFQIRYLHGKDKDHPYINRIKECALQSFTVNYTPEQTYMTFADGLMTSYEIEMTFQELEPIFNDDYTTLPGGNNDTEIGY